MFWNKFNERNLAHSSATFLTVVTLAWISVFFIKKRLVFHKIIPKINMTFIKLLQNSSKKKVGHLGVKFFLFNFVKIYRDCM